MRRKLKRAVTKVKGFMLFLGLAALTIVLAPTARSNSLL